MNYKKIYIFASLFFIPDISSAGWFNSDGNSFEDCMEKRRSEIKTDSQLSVAANYCRSKHPAKYVPLPESPQHYDIPVLNAEYFRFREKSNNITIDRSNIAHDGEDFGYGYKSYDFKYYLKLEVTNRNTFPISGLNIGFPKNKSKECGAYESDYNQIYSCYGNVDPKRTGIIRCDIPDVEKKKFNFCNAGFKIYTTESVYKRVMKEGFRQ